MNDPLQALDVWRCGRCAEDNEKSFDVCWNCGTSRDGTEDADFKPEVDVALSADQDTPLAPLRGARAGSAVATILTFVLWFLPALLAMQRNQALRDLDHLFMLVMHAALVASFAAVGGGIAGWIAARMKRPLPAMWKGAIVLTATLLAFLVLTGYIYDLSRLPLRAVIGLVGGIAVVGSIVGAIGAIFGRLGDGTRESRGPLQYSLRDLLNLTALLAVFSACLAALLR